MADDSENIEPKEDFKVPQYLLNAKKDAVDNCRMLYCGRYKPITRSLIPFGWEHGDGWNDVVARLSYKLEALNLMFYPKYGVRVEASQVKEKFGELRFYYDVVVEPPFLVRFIPNCLERLHDYITRKANFGYKSICDKESYTTEEWDEISKEDFDCKKSPEYVANDYGWRFKEENGKYYRNSCVFHPAKRHREATKNKFLHAIDNLVWKLHCMLDFKYSWRYPKSVDVIRNYVDSMAKKYVSEAEKECYDNCEICGAQIGVDYSPRCATTGWIRYVCGDCVRRNKCNYADENGDIRDFNGNIIKKKNEEKTNA